jgi:hypothetical protein
LGEVRVNKGKVPANKGVPMSEEQKAKIRAAKAPQGAFLLISTSTRSNKDHV